MTTTKVNGPPKKPSVLKQLQGTARPDRVQKREPKPTGPIGNPPTHLTAGAKRIWREVVSELPDGVLTGADRHQLELYSVLWDWVRDKMKVGGTPPTKEIVQVRQLAASFGLDPASRTRIATIDPPKDEDPFAALLNGNRTN